MAKQVESNPKSGATNKTPAPTHYVRDADNAYGMNGYRGASSVTPGQTTTSPLADELRRAQNDGQDVLGTVIAKGVAKDDKVGTFQERSESDKPYPITHGHHKPSGSPDGSVPASVIATKPAQPIRQPS
jgi:hypothetical protein